MSNEKYPEDIWQRRWNALETAIAGYTEELEQQSGPRITTLKNLLEQLRKFGHSQFEFFFNGFKENLFEPSPETPRENALYVIIDQVANDLEIIQRAIAQRSIGSSPMKRTLAQADSIAWDSLKLARAKGLMESDPTIVTYFQKSPSIRIIPYAPVALIGIPYTCIDEPRDFLSIYHEIGHFVYWNGKRGKEKTCTEVSDAILTALDKDSNNKTLNEDYFKTFPFWCYDWREEIFADVYGCRAEGESAIAAGFQEWLMHKSLAGFFDDDGKHPIPSLRPQIYINVLKNGTESSINTLTNEWNEQIKKREADITLLKNQIAAAAADDPKERNEQIREWRREKLRSKYHADINPEKPDNLASDAVDAVGAITNTASTANGDTDSIVIRIGDTVSTVNIVMDTVNVVIETIINYLDASIRESTTDTSVKPSTEVFLLKFEEKIKKSAAKEFYSSNDNKNDIWESWLKQFNVPVYSESDPLSSDIWLKILFADGWTTGPVLNPISK